MLYKVKKKLIEQRNRFKDDHRVEYIVRRYDINGKVIEDISFDSAYHAGLMRLALRGTKVPMNCSLIRREYDVNDASGEEVSYISVEKSV